jgi:uncharacterized membrane protein YvbJ
MFCPQCGNDIIQDDAFCPNCGAKVGAVQDKTETATTFAPSRETTFTQPYSQPYYSAMDDSLSAGYWICIFCLPIVGIVIYFQRRNNRPNSAKTALIIAIVSIIIGVIANS